MNTKASESINANATTLGPPCVVCCGNGTRQVDLAGAGGVMITACEACNGTGFVEKPPAVEPHSGDSHTESRWAHGCAQLAIFAPFMLGAYFLQRFLGEGFPYYLVFVIGPWWVLIPGIMVIEVWFRRLNMKQQNSCALLRSLIAFPLVLLSICGVLAAVFNEQFPFSVLKAIADWTDRSLWIVLTGPAMFFLLFFVAIFVPWSGPLLFRRLLHIKEADDQEPE